MSSRVTPPPSSPLNYTRSRLDPIRMFSADRPPTANDVRGFGLRDFWINITDRELYFFIGQTSAIQSPWIHLSRNADRAALAAFLRTENSFDVFPDPVQDSIRISGGPNILTFGSPVTPNEVEIRLATDLSINSCRFGLTAKQIIVNDQGMEATSIGGNASISLTTQAAGRVVVSNELTAEALTTSDATDPIRIESSTISSMGNSNININPAGTGIISCSKRLSAPTLSTSLPAQNLQLSSSTIAAGGSDQDVNITLTPKGDGVISTSATISAGSVQVANSISAPEFDADTFATQNTQEGLTITNNTITADGTDQNINIELVPKNSGTIHSSGSLLLDGTNSSLQARTIRSVPTATGGQRLTISNNRIAADAGTPNADIQLNTQGAGHVFINTQANVNSLATINSAGEELFIENNTISGNGAPTNVDINISPQGTGSVVTTAPLRAGEIAATRSVTGASIASSESSTGKLTVSGNQISSSSATTSDPVNIALVTQGSGKLSLNGVDIEAGGGNSPIHVYETGSFTPSVQLGGPAGRSSTYIFQRGHYVRIGQIVYYNFDIRIARVQDRGSGEVAILFGDVPANGTIGTTFPYGYVWGGEHAVAWEDVVLPTDGVALFSENLIRTPYLSFDIFAYRGPQAESSMPLTGSNLRNTSRLRSSGFYFVG